MNNYKIEVVCMTSYQDGSPVETKFMIPGFKTLTVKSGTIGGAISKAARQLFPIVNPIRFAQRPGGILDIIDSNYLGKSRRKPEYRYHLEVTEV